MRNIARPIHFVSRFINDVLAPNTDDMFEKNLSGYLSPELKPVAVIRFGFFDIHISYGWSMFRMYGLEIRK